MVEWAGTSRQRFDEQLKGLLDGLTVWQDHLVMERDSLDADVLAAGRDRQSREAATRDWNTRSETHQAAQRQMFGAGTRDTYMRGQGG